MSSLNNLYDCSSALSISLKKDNISSYEGILSNLSDEDSEPECSTTNDDTKKDKKKKNETQKVTFEWDKDEKDTVYLTGSFCNWKQFFIMPKINNIYSITLPLPKDIHKFKFRINDIFYTNQKYPIIKEGENDCNYIDTSPKELCQPKKNKSNINNISEENIDIDEIKSSKDLDESESNSESESHKFEDEEVNLIKKIKKKIEKMKKIKYSINYPKRNSMNNSAPIIPYPYNYIYNIDVNSSQKLIGKKKYYEPKENNILGDNCSYKKIEVLPTVEINHIHSNNLIISGKTVLCSTLSRYRNKFITFLYYKPF